MAKSICQPARHYFVSSFPCCLTQWKIYCWATPSAPAVQGDDVYYVTATKRYTTTAAAGAVGPLTGVFFDTSGGNGDIVEISIGNRVA